MRILKVSQYYPAYIHAITQKLSHGRGMDYQTALSKILADSFSWADFYTTAFRDKGHEMPEIIQNAEWLQDKFALEHGMKSRGLELLLEQVKFYKPEILFLDTLLITGDWIETVRREVSSVKRIGMFNCSPASIRTLELFRMCDFVITCHRGINEQYRSQGINSFHVFHGFGKAVLERISIDPARVKNQILFSGSLFPGSDFHDLRTQALEGFVRNKLPFVGYAYQDQTPNWKIWSKRVAYHSVNAISKLPFHPLENWSLYRRIQAWKEPPQKLNLSRELKKHLKSPLFGLEMYQCLADSSVIFNIHGGIAGQYASNMRMFEATGVGSCLLTDAKTDLSQLFEPEKEILTYQSLEECLEKARWLIENPVKAKEIGLAGQRRTLRDHTYESRAEQMIAVFRGIL